MVGRASGAELLSGLNTLTHVGMAGNLSDSQLLTRFLARGGRSAEAAFEVLVARHGPMVLDVCCKVLRDPHDAQDAFQATFLVLASRAGSIRRRDALAGWLLGVARRVAVRSRADQARRRASEGQAAEVRADLDGDRRESWPELHEEIGRLPQRYREPVVLCYLEGLSTDAAAMRLGCPKGTVLSRLSRARERLRSRLIRRGLTPATADKSARTAPVVVPLELIAATARASWGFAEQKASVASLSSATAVTLARGVIHAMTLSKLKGLGAALLACAVTLGGIQTFARQFGAMGGQNGAEPKADEPTAALNRLVDKLQTGLDESARRNTEMQKVVQSIRTDLKALRANRFAGQLMTDYSEAAGRLADALKRHPARLSKDPGWGYQIYMLDLIEGGTTLIVDEPLPGHLCSGRAKWSHDGRRIVFETAGGDWPRARLFAIEVRDGRPRFTELGDGNNPTFSPDDSRIAFALHAGNEAGAGGSVWVMNADGSGRHRAGDFGAPFWSPDGRELLVNTYAVRPRSTVINLATEEESAITVPGHRIFSWPSWAGPGLLVSALAPMEKYQGTSIALLDVRSPGKATITDVLWRRSQGPDVDPRWAVYRPDTRECFFVGVEPTKRMIYVVKRGEPLSARPLDLVEWTRPGQHQQLGGLSFSPDGRYLLFDANRTVRK